MAELPTHWHFVGFCSLSDRCLQQKKIRSNWHLFLVSPCCFPVITTPEKVSQTSGLINPDRNSSPHLLYSLHYIHLDQETRTELMFRDKHSLILGINLLLNPWVLLGVNFSWEMKLKQILEWVARLCMRPLSLHQIAGCSGTFKICTLPSWAVWFPPSFMIAGYEVITPISMT